MIYKSLAIVFCFLAAMVLSPAARADEWNQKTEMIFSQPVELPGIALPAGTYWFVLDDQDNRQVVQVFGGDWSRIFANLLTIPTDRKRSTDNTEVTFAERPHSQPEAVLDWYYPGFLTGHEFVYPRKEQRELTRAAERDIVVQPMNVASNALTPGA